MNYYDWEGNDIVCSKCGWSGKGQETQLGEMFLEGAEFHCPHCNHWFGFVPFPTIHETLADSRSDPVDCKAAESRVARRERFRLLPPRFQMALEFFERRLNLDLGRTRAEHRLHLWRKWRFPWDDFK